MKYLKYIFLILVIIIVGAAIYLYNQMSEPKENIINHANIEHIKTDLDSIVMTTQPRHFLNTNELNHVAAYIKKQFESISDSVSEQKFTVKNSEYKNIICSINTDKKERIVIGAHYDVCDEQDGADDNASGVAGMLELARLLKDKNLNYRIDFVAYTLEEPPYYATNNMGSYIHAKYLFDNKIPVKGMISMEMIGYFSDEKNSQFYPIPFLKYLYGDKGDFITIVQKFNCGDFANKFSKQTLANASLKTIVFQGPKILPGIDFSDHRNYWSFGYSAVMVTNTAFYRNKNYHNNTDKLNTLDINRLSLVVNQLYEAMQKL